MKSTKEVDWRDSSTLHDLSAFEAMQVLTQISEALKYSTRDEALTHDQRFGLDVSVEAAEFAAAANRLGSRLRSAGDCRPGLRVAADEKRQADPAQDFAEQARRHHRLK